MSEVLSKIGHNYVTPREIGEGLAHEMGTTLEEIRASGNDRSSFQLRLKFARAFDIALPGTPRIILGELMGRSKAVASDYTKKSRHVDPFIQRQARHAAEAYKSHS